MPIIAIKGVSAIMALLFSWTLFLPGNNTPGVEVEMKAFQNNSFYGSIDIDGEKDYLEILYLEGSKEDNNKSNSNDRVKINFRRKGKDVSLIYEHGQKVEEVDLLIINKLLEELEKETITDIEPRGKIIKQKITNIFQGIINRSSKRGPVRKFLP